LKVFLDTNVWLSATVFAGLCEALLTQCADRGWLLTTALVREEAQEVLARKFPQLPAAQALFDQVWSAAACVPDVDVPADDNDARLVAAAQAAGADFFVTGDRRVLTWGTAGDMKIVNPRQAWAALFAAGASASKAYNA
jgi:putative PIN family toxin of toxin-antitoxin system